MPDLSHLQSYLRSVAMSASPGEKLPTVRRLMQDFKLTQPNVQRVLNGLKEEGLISAHVGRGTFFTGTERGSAETIFNKPLKSQGRSVILLRRSSHTLRGRVVLDHLQRRLAADGHVTLEVGYSSADHAKQVLQTLPRFDACIVQNSFQTMPIDMIMAVRRKTDTVVVDGAWLVGTDIDSVGFEWGDPVERAVRMLVDTGHERIFLLTTESFFLANELGLHRYRRLRSQPELASVLQSEIQIDRLPPLDYEDIVVAALSKHLEGSEGKVRQALIVWGIENGARFRALLDKAGLAVPGRLSVVLLGRTDIDAETGGFFHMFGYSAHEQAEAVLERLHARWREPDAPFGLQLVPMHEQFGQSVRGLASTADANAGPPARSARGENRSGATRIDSG